MDSEKMASFAAKAEMDTMLQTVLELMDSDDGTVSYTHLDVYKRQVQDILNILRSRFGLCLTFGASISIAGNCHSNREVKEIRSVVVH